MGLPCPPPGTLCSQPKQSFATLGGLVRWARQGTNQVPERRLALPRAVASICASRAGPKGAQLGTERLPCTWKKGCLFLMHTEELSGLVAALSPMEDGGRD